VSRLRGFLLVLAGIALFAYLLGGAMDQAAAGSAHSYPVTVAAKRWEPADWWMRQALCIHRHESVDWHRAGVDWRGRPSPYYGGMQFLLSTWRRAGGSGLPSSWAPREQLYRAHVIWRRNGGSWREWGTAGRCGLR
jgi:hypothetical protein